MTPCPFCKSDDISPALRVGFPVATSCNNCMSSGPAKCTAKEADAAWDQCKITGETSDGYHTFNDLYEHRHALFLALASLTDSWMSKKHHDESEMEGWFIAGIRLKEGDISYHLPMRLWNTFSKGAFVVLPKAPPRDGHTSKDVIDRLMKYATS